MGFDLGRFPEEVDEELVCPICSAVLQDPVQAPLCEHAFCRSCIAQWLAQAANCPVDRRSLSEVQLEPVPRILRNLLGRLRIKCANELHGCEETPRLDALEAHEAACEANPSRPVPCELGCGLSLPPDQVSSHSCVSALREAIAEQRVRLATLEERVASQATCIADQAREIRSLQSTVHSAVGSVIDRAMSPSAFWLPEGGSSAAMPEPARVQEWATTLPRARVVHWGRLISTPDVVLQSVIRRSLLDSACDAVVAEELMSRSDERGWPPGLRSLEMRQLNRRSFDRFICRRLPGNQAVLLLDCENGALPPNLSLPPPGIIMIFANGVESVTSL